MIYHEYVYSESYWYSDPGSVYTVPSTLPASQYNNLGSIYSNYGSEDPESDSDNCSPQKLDPQLEDQDFDHIAKILYNHPTIQAVMNNNL